MDCRDCGVPMVPGKVMAPVWGSVTQIKVERGDTIYPISAALTDCLKCPKCGHSVAPMLVREDARTTGLSIQG